MKLDEFDPAMAVGHINQKGWEIISVPSWNGKEWTALANVGGALALIALQFTIRGDHETR